MIVVAVLLLKILYSLNLFNCAKVYRMNTVLGKREGGRATETDIEKEETDHAHNLILIAIIIEIAKACVLCQTQ